MFFLRFLFLSLAAVTTALNVTVQDRVPSSPSYLIHTTDHTLNSCGQANIEDIVDSKSLTEVILWNVGTLTLKEKETSCKVALAIRYSQGWSYTITDVSWRGHIVLEPDAQATISFKASYEGGLQAYSNTWTLRDQSGGPGGWGRPKGDPKIGRDWEDRKFVKQENQVWSPSEKMSPLNIDWKVSFQSAKTLGMFSVLGDTSKGGNPLALRIGLKFKKL